MTCMYSSRLIISVSGFAARMICMAPVRDTHSTGQSKARRVAFALR